MVGAIVVGVVAVVFLIIGWLLWRKERISLLHDYHRDKVSPENQKAFCTLSGLGVMTIGLGLLVTAIAFGITESVWSFLAFGAGFALGIGLLICAGKKYNR